MQRIKTKSLLAAGLIAVTGCGCGASAKLTGHKLLTPERAHAREVASSTSADRPSSTPANRPSSTPANRPSSTPANRPSSTAANRPSSTSATRPTADPKRLTNADFRGLSDRGKRFLQNYRMWMSDCPIKKDPNDAPVVAAEMLSKCGDLIKNQQARLDKVPASDHNHPVYIRLSKYQKHLVATYAHWQQERKEYKQSRANAGRAASELKRATNAHKHTLWVLGNTDKGKFPRLEDALDFTKLVKQVDALAPLANNCAGKFAPVFKDSNAQWEATADRAPKPARVCELAQKRDAIMKRLLAHALPAWAQARYSYYQGWLANLREHGATSDEVRASLSKKQLQKDIANATSKLAPIAKRYGLAMPTAEINKWQALYRELPKAMAAAAARRPKLDRERNHQVLRAARHTYRGTPFRVKKVGLVSSHPHIVRNALGRPLKRVWSGEVLVHERGERFCRAYGRSFVATYEGGGHYQKPRLVANTVTGGDYVISRCH